MKKLIPIAGLLLAVSIAAGSVWVGRVSPKTGKWSEWETVGTQATVKGTDGQVRVWSEETEAGTIFHVVAEANEVIGGTLIPDMNLRFRGNYQVDVRFEKWGE